MSMETKRIYITESQLSALKKKLKQAREDTNTKPTEKQKESGNYAKGKINILGYNIVLENPKGSYRSGTDKNGKKWKTLMYNDYGYFSHTLAIDGDAVDVFLGNHLNSDKVFVIDQKVGGKFDESKVMLGFNSEKEAKEAYLSNYEVGWKGFWKITEVNHNVFKEWLYDGYKQRKPFSEYVDIKKNKLNESTDLLFENIIDDEYYNYDSVYVIDEFLKNTQGHQTWEPLINPSMYQKALDTFSKFGSLEGFPTKYIYQWLGIIVKNSLILNANTELAGHSQWFPYNDLENSDLTEYLRDNYDIIHIEYGDKTVITCTPQYIIDNIKNNSRYLSQEEKSLLDKIEQELNSNNLNEDAVHQSGPNKGQMAMFVSQPELDDYDYRQYIKNANATKQTLVDIYNRLFGEQENKANYSFGGNKARVTNSGEIEVNVGIFNLLDEIGLYDWMIMPDGSDAWSDFGLDPLFKILNDYDDNTTPEEALVMINKCLDVTHCRGDISSIFIEGGKNTLFSISNDGYVNENKNRKNVYLTESQVQMLLEALSIEQKYELEKQKGKTNLDFNSYKSICEIDPTTKNGITGKYCNWLLIHNAEITDENKRQLRISLEQFNDGLKRHILTQHGVNTDIGSYKTIDVFLQTMYHLMHSDDLSMSQSEFNNREKLNGQFDILGSNDMYEVINPKTYAAERYFGSGTEWCTVGDKSYFQDYTKHNQKLYIWYPKNGDNKLKMQFHFESESFATYEDDVRDMPKDCIGSVFYYDEDNMIKTFELYNKIFGKENGNIRIIRTSEVQELLDKGINPNKIFDECNAFEDGHALICLNNKYNFLRRNKKLLSPSQWFDWGYDFENGFGMVKLNSKFNYLNTEGELLSPNQWFDWCLDFENGYARVKLNGNWNLLSTKGKLFKTREEAREDSNREYQLNEETYIAYHGSPCREIVTGRFKHGKNGHFGPAIYFSQEKDYTRHYAKKFGAGAIYKVEIDIYNPLILTSIDGTKELLTKIYGTESIYNRRMQKQTNENYIVTFNDLKKLQQKGYDGIIWDYAGNKEYVVFDNSQIKILDKEDIDESEKK